MNSLYSVAITVCCASLICAIASNFVTDGSIKKILNLVLGAFAVCSMLVPVKAAISDFQVNYEEYQTSDELTATADEVVRRQLVNQTKSNLEQTLTAILAQNNITPDYVEIILAVSDDNNIIISDISIYINESYLQSVDLISELTTKNFGVVPNIITQ